jgi:hypothetical protein
MDGIAAGNMVGIATDTTTAGAITDTIMDGTRPPPLLAPPLAWPRFPLPWRRAVGPITSTHIMDMAILIIGSSMGMIPSKGDVPIIVEIEEAALLASSL